MLASGDLRSGSVYCRINWLPVFIGAEIAQSVYSDGLDGSGSILDRGKKYLL
jgi:hypothetical protein